MSEADAIRRIGALPLADANPFEEGADRAFQGNRLQGEILGGGQDTDRHLPRLHGSLGDA